MPDMKIIKQTTLEDGSFLIEAAGLSTDTKPTRNISTGSIATETNTGDVYMYNESSAAWAKICALGGSGT
jgi:hypothetical protein